MIILPLGIGNASTKKYYQSNIIIEFNKTRLLIDAGTTLRYGLECAAIEPETIQYIFITHFHHDHVGGLAELLSISYWRFTHGKHVPHRPVLLFRPSQLRELDSILSPTLNNQGLTWTDYCIPIEIKNDVYQLQDHILEIIPTDSLHCEGLNSCGLKFIHKKSGKNIVLSGDIKKLSESNLLAKVDGLTCAIIQDVSFKNNPVHAMYDEILNYYPPHLHTNIYGIHFEDDIDYADTYLIHLMEQGKTLTI